MNSSCHSCHQVKTERGDNVRPSSILSLNHHGEARPVLTQIYVKGSYLRGIRWLIAGQSASMLTSFSVCQGEWGGPLPLPLLLNGSLSLEFQSEKERVGKKSDWRGDYIVTIWREEEKKKKHVITSHTHAKPEAKSSGVTVRTARWEELEKERRRRGRQPRRWREEKLNECFRFLLFWRVFFFPLSAVSVSHLA